MKKRIISLLLIAALASTPLVSCGSDNNTPNDDTTTSSSTDDVTTEADSKEPSGVPSDLDLKGETINIWYTTVSASIAEDFVDLSPEESGDILDDATYNMNRTVEERLNCKLGFYNSGVPTNETGTEVRKMLLSDDTSYDLFHVVQWNAAILAGEGLYRNMYDAPYISFDKPWWDNAYMSEMTIGANTIYGLVGDYAVDRTRCLDCVYYNKEMYNDYYGDPDGLYDLVLEGKWTMDKMMEIGANAFKDLNNDGAADLDDQIGYAVNNYNNIDVLFYGSGTRITERDKDNLPVIVLNNERAADVCSKIYSFCFENSGVYLSDGEYETDVKIRQKFADSESMFLIGFFYTLEQMRDMKSNFGILPPPKYDEAQANYVSDVHNIMRFYVVPKNCQKVETVSAVLEELSYEGYNSVLPKYYEIVLKNKYTRDDISAQMIDLIRDSCKPEIAHIYSAPFNYLGNIAKDLIQKKSSNFASQYASKEAKAKTELEKFINQFLSIDN